MFLWPGFLKEIDCTIFHELQLPLRCFIWWGNSRILCLQKDVRLSSVLLLLPFYEAFSIPVKNQKSKLPCWTDIHNLTQIFKTNLCWTLIYKCLILQLDVTFKNNVKVFFHNLSAPKECFNCKECSCLYLYIRPSMHCETKDIFNVDFVIFWQGFL